jgi:hypothetical protein
LTCGDLAGEARAIGWCWGKHLTDGGIMAVKRVGHSMRRIAEYVAEHPGCTKSQAITALHYRTQAWACVNRAVAAGIVRALPGKGNAYEMYVSPDYRAQMLGGNS